jgi:hypothetical protein
MSTLKRRLASRENSKKSTGPVTEAGKRTVARNAIRHGLLSNSTLLTGESDHRFNELLEKLTFQLQPENEWELALVDMMAVSRWRQMRLWGFGKATVMEEILKQESAASPSDRATDVPTQGARAFRSIVDQSSVLQVLNRYETGAYRMFFRSMAVFRDLRAERNLPAIPGQPDLIESGDDISKQS